MWQKHFEELYNSTSDSNARDSLLQRITDVSCGSGGVTISIQDVAEACTKQKYGKAVGLDGIAMEAFIYGAHRLHVHLCMLFNNVYKMWLCTRFIYEECNYTPGEMQDRQSVRC